MSTLPAFRYHPDPIETGSVLVSDGTCINCNQARGYMYAGPVYAEEDYDEKFCPWCIADGSAHTKFSASFTDESGIGGYGAWDSVTDDVIAEVAYRTPGFSGWQQEQWWTHCGDAAEFLGCQGQRELKLMGTDAIEAIRQNTGLEGSEWEHFYHALSKHSSPTAYLFRCRHCGTIGGYGDGD